MTDITKENKIPSVEAIHDEWCKHLKDGSIDALYPFWFFQKEPKKETKMEVSPSELKQIFEEMAYEGYSEHSGEEILEMVLKLKDKDLIFDINAEMMKFITFANRLIYHTPRTITASTEFLLGNIPELIASLQNIVILLEDKDDEEDKD